MKKTDYSRRQKTWYKLLSAILDMDTWYKNTANMHILDDLWENTSDTSEYHGKEENTEKKTVDIELRGSSMGGGSANKTHTKKRRLDYVSHK